MAKILSGNPVSGYPYLTKETLAAYRVGLRLEQAKIISEWCLDFEPPSDHTADLLRAIRHLVSDTDLLAGHIGHSGLQQRCHGILEKSEGLLSRLGEMSADDGCWQREDVVRDVQTNLGDLDEIIRAALVQYGEKKAHMWFDLGDHLSHCSFSFDESEHPSGTDIAVRLQGRNPARVWIDLGDHDLEDNPPESSLVDHLHYDDVVGTLLSQLGLTIDQVFREMVREPGRFPRVTMLCFTNREFLPWSFLEEGLQAMEEALSGNTQAHVVDPITWDQLLMLPGINKKTIQNKKAERPLPPTVAPETWSYAVLCQWFVENLPKVVRRLPVYEEATALFGAPPEQPQRTHD